LESTKARRGGKKKKAVPKDEARAGRYKQIKEGKKGGNAQGVWTKTEKVQSQNHPKTND